MSNAAADIRFAANARADQLDRTPADNDDSVTTELVAPPRQITNLRASGTSAHIDVRWRAPGDNGSAITRYDLERKEASGSYAPVTPGPGVAATTYQDSQCRPTPPTPTACGPSTPTATPNGPTRRPQPPKIRHHHYHHYHHYHHLHHLHHLHHHLLHHHRRLKLGAVAVVPQLPRGPCFYRWPACRRESSASPPTPEGRIPRRSCWDCGVRYHGR